MRKHKKYDLVKPLFTLGEIKEFRDIFNHVPKTAVALRLGKEKGRFNELIEDPNGFTIQELMKLGKDCNLSLPDLGRLIETQHPSMPQPDITKTRPYKAVGLLVKDGGLHRLEEIFDYIPIYAVAEHLGRKPDTVSRFLKHVEKFQVKDLRILARLCELPLVTMLALVEAQSATQKKKQN